MDGDFPTPAGVARTSCEKEDWLVVSPTRAEFVDKYGVKSQTRDDGVSLYRVGASRPVAIPSLSEEMGGGPMFLRHSDAVKSHDTKQVVAGGLGIAGAIAVAVGTVLFVSAFSNEPGNDVAVNPGQAERSRAEAARHVFFPPQEPKEDVVEMSGRYNQAVRDRCERRAAP
ncbi:MAG: hypothetical protein K0R38_2508 [Polyangiaceae bacterium]|nr:hypothetical protein [Polyangiaceae bacterium]